MPASITAIASVTATIRPLLKAQRCPSESLNMSVPNLMADCQLPHGKRHAERVPIPMTATKTETLTPF